MDESAFVLAALMAFAAKLLVGGLVLLILTLGTPDLIDGVVHMMMSVS